MKLLIIALPSVAMLLTSCGGIQIAGEKIPYPAACGSLGIFKCRAQGSGPLSGSNSSIVFKERVNLAAAIHYNVGRIYMGPYETRRVLEVTPSDYVQETGDINADFTSKIIKSLKAELKAKLKQSNYNVEAQANIINNFHSQIETHLKVEAKFHVLTLQQGLLDQIDDYGRGDTPDHLDPRVPGIVQKLRNSRQPLIRQVFVVEESINYSDRKTLKNTLEAAIQGAGEISTDAKASILIEGMLETNKTRNITANSKLTSVYSYGLFKAPWFYGKQ